MARYGEYWRVMERNEVSVHEAKIYCAFLTDPNWKTSREIAKAASVAERTARQHCLRLVHLGIVDQAEVFPAHRYRISEKAKKRNISYVQRLEQACAVFNLKKL